MAKGARSYTLEEVRENLTEGARCMVRELIRESPELARHFDRLTLALFEYGFMVGFCAVTKKGESATGADIILLADRAKQAANPSPKTAAPRNPSPGNPSPVEWAAGALPVA